VTSVETPIDPVAPVTVPPVDEPPGVWKFWGTCLWGLFAAAALFAGQMAAVGYDVVVRGAPIDASLIVSALSSGTTIALSVLLGLPAVSAALWLAIRLARMRFTDYLALHGTSWKNVVLGIVSLVVLVLAWEFVATFTGKQSSPDFMQDVLKSARANGALWLLVLAICVGAPMTEEFLVRGFLYRGWSESFLRVPGAIVLSSLVWTAMHLQYDWFFFCEIFTVGLLFGYMRYRSNSTWLTIFLHGLNNLAATLQTLYLATHPQ
jgi:membrane protease YdiL (CAAX protease family)